MIYAHIKITVRLSRSDNVYSQYILLQIFNTDERLKLARIVTT